MRYENGSSIGTGIRLVYLFWTLLLSLLVSTSCQVHETTADTNMVSVSGLCRHTTTLWVDPTFTESQRTEIDQALDAWSRATPECWRQVSTYKVADVRILHVHNFRDITDSFAVTDGEFVIGLWAPTPHRIWLTEDDLTNTEFRTVASHEIGHYLGLEHTKNHDNESLMAPTVQKDFLMGPESEIPAVDVRTYWEKRNAGVAY